MSTLLNDTPWLATVECSAPLTEVHAWFDAGLELGVLKPQQVEQTDVDVILDLGGRVINFIGNDMEGQ